MGYTPPQSNSVDVLKDVRALNSNILVISQKIQDIVRNEKILGRNLLVLNKKVKDLQVQLVEISEKGLSSKVSAVDSPELNQLKEKQIMLTNKLNEVSSSIERLNQSLARKEDIAELKYLVDTINPLEFVTFRQVEELIQKKIDEKLSKNSLDLEELDTKI